MTSSNSTLAPPRSSLARPSAVVAVVGLVGLLACSPERPSDAVSLASAGSGGAGGNSGSGTALAGGVTAAGGTTASSAGATNDAGGSAGSSAEAGGAGGGAGSAGAAGNGGGPSVVYPFEPQGPPFTTQADIFDQSEADTLGLSKASGTETVSIFRPSDKSDHYSNGVVLTAFNGYLYAQWQSSPTDEDSTDTWTAFSRSQDGKTWSAPAVLAAKSSDERASGGWWVAGQTLVAYVNVYPTGVTPRSGYTEVLTSQDGVGWSAPKKLPMLDGSTLNGVFEQDPHALPDGRIIGAAHFGPGLMVAPVYTDDPSGTAGWVRAPFANLDHTGQVSRELEPSWFLRGDGAAVMIFRDQTSTYAKLASMSGDRGATWTTPVLTDMPDSRAKQSAGNLPDGTAYQVNNPVTTNRRWPLAVTLSRDGHVFDKAFALRLGGGDLQAQRYAGKSKGLGYSYPKSMVHDGYLYVGYAVNKEDVEYTRVPLTSLTY